MIIAVIERDYAIANEDFRDRYIGVPCRSFDEARELCAAHLSRHNELHVVDYIDNGVHYAETDGDTGEIVKEFFVRAIG
jgi:hypothetical protein